MWYTPAASRSILDSLSATPSSPLLSYARKMVTDFSAKYNPEIIVAIAANKIQNKTKAHKYSGMMHYSIPTASQLLPSAEMIQGQRVLWTEKSDTFSRACP